MNNMNVGSQTTEMKLHQSNDDNANDENDVSDNLDEENETGKN
jgi:hypothetical protein